MLLILWLFERDDIFSSHRVTSTRPALSNTEYETRSYCNGEFAFVQVAAPAL
jgi:hypothetical protein